MAVRFSEVYLQMFEDDRRNVRIYAFDWCDDTVVWKLTCRDFYFAAGIWRWCCRESASQIEIPSLYDSDIKRRPNSLSWLIGDSRDITEENPYGMDHDSIKAHGSVLFERMQALYE